MKPDTIIMMPIEDIEPYCNNPRRHDNISEVKAEKAEIKVGWAY